MRRAGDLLSLLLCAACSGGGAPPTAGDDTAPTGGDDTAVDSPADSGDDTAADSGDDTAEDTAEDTAPPDCTTLLWYPDDDADAFGRTADAVCADEAPDDSYVLDPDDCDDTDPLIHPLAEDDCEGVDVDCDGDLYSDWCEGGLAAVAVWWYSDASWGGAGEALSVAPDLDGDGRDDLVVSAPNNSDLASGAGKVFVLLGPADTGGLLSAADAVITGSAGDELAQSLAGLPDQDGDGYAELLIATSKDDTAIPNGGGVFLFAGPLATLSSKSDADAALSGKHGEGLALALGDLDGDGALELAVAGRDSVTLAAAPGVSDGWSGLEGGLARVEGLDATQALGCFDLDGDGLDELLIGDPGQSRFADNAGAIYLFAGPLVGPLKGPDAEAVWSGAAEGDGAGTALGAADLDGDGQVELLGAAPGAALVAGLTYSAGFHSLSSAFAQIVGPEGDGLGASVTAVGDLDGDSFEDLVIGAAAQDEPWEDGGGVWVVYGPISGSVAAADVGENLSGPVRDGLAGWAVAAGDLDGDGHPDVAVGEPAGRWGDGESGAVGLLFDLGL